VCSMSITPHLEADIQSLHEKIDIAARLAIFADEADRNTPGALENDTGISRLPDDLRSVRKVRIGRHRVYFTGHHSECAYQAFLLKPNKRTGVLDEDDPVLHGLLRRAIAEPATNVLEVPRRQVPAPSAFSASSADLCPSDGGPLYMSHLPDLPRGARGYICAVCGEAFWTTDPEGTTRMFHRHG